MGRRSTCLAARRGQYFATLALVLAAIPAAADQTRPSLVGVVTDEEGEPLTGVRIDISTAAPKVGRGIFCPSCYLDCRKWAKTDQEGRFSIDKLDPSLKFRMIAALPGFRTAQTKLMDPDGGAVTIQLLPLPDDIDPTRLISGLVRSESGTPIPGAMVAPYGARKADRRWWGKVDGIDPTVTDDRGRFTLIVPDDFLALDIEITADGHCGKLAYGLTSGGEAEPIVVPVGASVTGTIVRNGQPVPNISVAVVQLERGVSEDRGIFIAAVGAVTKSDGTFQISNLPPDQSYCVYSVVGEAKRTDANDIVPVKVFDVPGSGKTRDLGSLEVAEPIEIRGRVRPVDDEPTPKNLEIAFGRDPAWDLISFPVAEDGSFVARGLPPETYEIRVGSRELVIASEEIEYQVLSENSFGLHATESVSELVIPVRRKPKDGGTQSVRRDTPARVTEQSKPGVTLSGRVVAAGKPVRNVTIKLFRAPPRKPGQRGDRFEAAGEVQTDPQGRYSFDGLATGQPYYFATISYGNLEVHNWRHQHPYIQTVRAADGHRVELPDAVLIGSDQTLSGVVIDPDGKPVGGLTVNAQLASGRILSRPDRGPPPWTQTDDEGKFTITNLPGEPIRLMVYRRNSQQRTVKYPAYVEAKENARDIRVVLDPKLGSGIESLD